MKLASNWKITFDPAGAATVLLAFGDDIEGEPRFPLGRGLEIVTLPGAAAPFLRPTGNSSVRLQINVYTSKTTDALARAAVLDSLIAIDATTRKPTKIEVAGLSTSYWIFAESYIQEHTPARELDAPEAGLVKSYTIVATGLSKVTP